MEKFTFLLKHKDGTANKVADALSRKFSLLTTISYKILGFDLLSEQYAADPYFSKLMKRLNEASNDEYLVMNVYLFKGG